jgi:3-hydroxyisobutyrate dehydrogenase-like beta-hydroxyacid dehydrogenase
LGQQGAPIARAIATAGFELHVWARRAASHEALAGLPFTAHDEVAGLGAICDPVLLCVRDDPDVEEILVAQGLLESMVAGSIVVNHGTGDPAASVRFGEAAARHDITYLDAPVSAARPGSEPVRVTTIVGGDAEAVARCRPLFDAYSVAVHHLGPTGAGQLAKLLNNALTIANVRSSVEVLQLARTLGLDVATLIELVDTSAGANAALHALHRPITPDGAHHVDEMMRKDIGMFGRAMRERGVDPHVLEDWATGAYGRFSQGVEIVSGTVLAGDDRKGAS